MADYLPQPDSGGTCCDCPVRTSPCDNCGCNAANCPPPLPNRPCTLDLSVSTPHGYSISQTGLLIANGDCAFGSVGWHSCVWFSCGDCSGCNVIGSSCQCGFSAEWNDSPSTFALFDVNLIQGDPAMTPDGWWLSALIRDGTCAYGYCALPAPYTFCTECFVRIGTNASIFSTALHVSMDIPPKADCPDQTDHATLDITFHPC